MKSSRHYMGCRRFEILITVVVLVVGAFRFRAVVRAAWGALVFGSRLRCSVWSSFGCCDRRAGLGFILWSRPTPLALIVWLLWVGLSLHPLLLHGTVAARVVILGACRAPRAARLTARAVPTPIWLAVGLDALPVAALVIRSWPAVSLLSVWEKVKKILCWSNHALTTCLSVNSHLKAYAFTCLQLFSVHPHLTRNQKKRWWPWTWSFLWKTVADAQTGAKNEIKCIDIRPENIFQKDFKNIYHNTKNQTKKTMNPINPLAFFGFTLLLGSWSSFLIITVIISPSFTRSEMQDNICSEYLMCLVQQSK